MARGRLVTKELTNDNRFNRMSEKARLLFLLAWPHLDRDARIDGTPRKLWAMIDIDHIENMDKMATYIEEWLASGLVTRYETTKGPVLFFLEFRYHNLRMTYSDEAASVWPPPPDWHNTKQGPVPNSPELAERMAQSIEIECKYKAELLRQARVKDNELIDDGHAAAAAKIAELAELEAEMAAARAKIAELAKLEAEKQAKIAELEADLTTNLNRTVTGREPAGNRTTTRREDQDQDQHDVAVDHGLAVPPSEYRGGSGGGADHLALCEEADLRRTAWELGLGLFGYGWTNYEAFVQRKPINTIIQLLEWIIYYNALSLEQIEKIREIPAVLHAHIKRNEHASLRRPQREELIRLVLTSSSRTEIEEPADGGYAALENR